MRVNGWVYEAVAALWQRRARRDLYHAALEVTTPGGIYVVEMTPIPDANGAAARGVVSEGAVGSRLLGRFRLFRYEIRRWRGGTIDDVVETVASPVRVSVDREVAERVLALVAEVPQLVWGRDELGAHDMWNSNSLVSWLLVRSGIDAKAAMLPPGGRAPGWSAGVVAASSPPRPGRARARRRETLRA